MNCGKEVDDNSKVNYARLKKKSLSKEEGKKEVAIEVVEERAVSSYVEGL